MNVGFVRDRWNRIAAAGVLLVYLSLLAVMPKHVFWAPDEGGRFIHMQTLHWDHGLRYALPYPGQHIDPALAYFPHANTPGERFLTYPGQDADGTVYFHWPIWFALLSRLFMAAVGITGIYIVPLLSGWLTAVLTGRLMFEIRPSLAPAAIGLAGLASPLCFYSQTFWDHTLATLLASIAALILVRARGGQAATFILMAPLLLAAMTLRIELLAFGVAAVLTWVVGLSIARARSDELQSTPEPRQPLSTHAFTACVVVALLLLVALLAASPRRHSERWRSLPQQLQENVAKVQVMPRALRALLINTSTSEGPMLPMVWERIALLALAATLVAAVVDLAWVDAAIGLPGMIVLLAFSTAMVSMPQSYRALHGIVPVAPYTVVAAFALRHAWRRRQLPLLKLIILTVFYLVFGLTANFVIYVTAGGVLQNSLEWGPRYLLTAYPLLTVLSLAAVQSYYESPRPVLLRVAFVGVAVGLMSVGLQQQARGLRMLHSNRVALLHVDQLLREDGPVVTDLWWLPTAVAEFFTTRDMHFVAQRGDVAGWLPLASSHGVRSFCFASYSPVTAAELGIPLLGDPAPAIRAEGIYLTRFTIDTTGPPPR